MVDGEEIGCIGGAGHAVICFKTIFWFGKAYICGINFTRIQAVGVEYTTRGRLQVCLYSTVGSRHHGKKEFGPMIFVLTNTEYSAGFTIRFHRRPSACVMQMLHRRAISGQRAYLMWIDLPKPS